MKIVYITLFFTSLLLGLMTAIHVVAPVRAYAHIDLAVISLDQADQAEARYPTRKELGEFPDRISINYIDIVEYGDDLKKAYWRQTQLAALASFLLFIISLIAIKQHSSLKSAAVKVKE